jgi:hypothetical protein
MVFGLLHSFVTVIFFRNPTPNLEDQGLHFIWPYSLTYLAWVALPGAYASAGIRAAIALTKITLILGIGMTIVRLDVDIGETLSRRNIL